MNNAAAVATVSFLFNRPTFSSDHSRLGQACHRYLKEPFAIADVWFLHARCPSCQPTNSVKTQRTEGSYRIYIMQNEIYVISSLLPVCLLLGSGVKTEPSTALGITETFDGSIAERRTVFSLLKTDVIMQEIIILTLHTWIATLSKTAKISVSVDPKLENLAAEPYFGRSNYKTATIFHRQIKTGLDPSTSESPDVMKPSDVSKPWLWLTFCKQTQIPRLKSVTVFHVILRYCGRPVC